MEADPFPKHILCVRVDYSNSRDTTTLNVTYVSNPASTDRNTNTNCSCCTLRSKTIRHNTFIDNGYGMETNKFPDSMQPDGNHVHKVHSMILPQYSSLHFVPSHSISNTVILIIFYHLYLGLTSNLFPWVFKSKV